MEPDRSTSVPQVTYKLSIVALGPHNPETETADHEPAVLGYSSTEPYLVTLDQAGTLYCCDFDTLVSILNATPNQPYLPVPFRPERSIGYKQYHLPRAQTQQLVDDVIGHIQVMAPPFDVILPFE